jgi:hypothetical protein
MRDGCVLFLFLFLFRLERVELVEWKGTIRMGRYTAGIIILVNANPTSVGRAVQSIPAYAARLRPTFQTDQTKHKRTPIPIPIPVSRWLVTPLVSGI